MEQATVRQPNTGKNIFPSRTFHLYVESFIFIAYYTQPWNWGNCMARDKFHEEVRTALQGEGWAITDDPLYLKVGRIPVHIDLGAEKLIGAEKEGQKIAVEVKTFGIASFITALHEAVGKYLIYREALKLVDSSRVLFLAMPADIYDAFGDEPLVKAVFTKHEFKIILYEPDTEKIKSWIK